MSVLLLVDAKAYLNITASTYDAELQTFIDSAEAAIVKRTGPLVSTATTATPVRGLSRQLQLPIGPAISLTSVTDNSGSTVNISDLTVFPGAVVEYTNGGYFGGRWYTVVYQAGRTSTPADLLMCVKQHLADLWQSQRGATTRPGLAPSEPSMPFLFSYKVQSLMEPYVQTGFA